MHLEGTGINPTPVDLHELQLSLEQHSQAHRIRTIEDQQSTSPSPQNVQVRFFVLTQFVFQNLGRSIRRYRSPASSRSGA